MAFGGLRMNEQIFLFGENKTLIGILTEPEERPKCQDRPAFIFLNSGIIHRIGANRQTVRMARDLAEMGFSSGRIDLSGIGDSVSDGNGGSSDALNRWIREIQAAMDALDAKKGVQQFILAGGCSGAFMAMKVALCDPRVVGAVLISLPGEKSPIRYFLRLALFNRKSWLRVISGKAKYDKLKSAINNIRAQFKFRKEARSENPDVLNVADDLRMLIEKKVNLLLVYSEWEPGLDYFFINFRRELRALSSQGKFKAEIIKGMNHDFSILCGQQKLIRIVHDWAAAMGHDRS